MDEVELSAEQIDALAQDPAIVKEVVENTDAGQAILTEALEAAEARREEAKAAEGAQAEINASLQAAIQSGDFTDFGELMARRYVEAQQQAAVATQVDAAAEEKLLDVIEANYGDLIRSLDPAEVKELDAMPLEDAIKVLNQRQAKAQATEGESLTTEDRARAIAERKMEVEAGDAEEWDGVMASIRRQAGAED